MFIILNEKLADVNLIMMPPLSEFFMKGLINAHTLAIKVYEKGPQSLADTIREVEKLQAAQQLTLPPSSVNTMSSDDNKCFQCQETGHMACYCPHIRCFDCDNYGHVTADCPNCPDEIPPSGIPARCRDNNTSRHYRSTSRSNNHNRHYHHDNRDRHRFSRS